MFELQLRKRVERAANEDNCNWIGNLGAESSKGSNHSRRVRKSAVLRIDRPTWEPKRFPVEFTWGQKLNRLTPGTNARVKGLRIPLSIHFFPSPSSHRGNQSPKLLRPPWQYFLFYRRSKPIEATSNIKKKYVNLENELNLNFYFIIIYI